MTDEDDINRLQIRLGLVVFEEHVSEVRKFSTRLCEETDVPTKHALRTRLLQLRTELNMLIERVLELDA